MRRSIVILAIAALALSAAWTAVAVEPAKIKPQARALTQEDFKLPVTELKKLQPPPNLQLKPVERIKPRVIAAPEPGPDLVPLEPTWLNPPRFGPAAGFPAAQFQGWRADWKVKNIGNQPGTPAPPPWKVHFSCEVINVPPGTEQFEYYNHIWCGFSEGSFNMAGALPPNGLTAPGAIKIFVGYPLYPCAYPNAPKPRITFKVDSGANVNERVETNNEYQIDVCTR
ncbi:MAG: hypothetical protein ACOY3Y_05765 [Acidobacteriota bacterium]